MLVNGSSRNARYLEVGDRAEGNEVEYPDADMAIRKRRRVREDETAFE
jgi:uncharacterized cupin superfamily protein